MSRDLCAIYPNAINGEVLSEAALGAEQMCSMNFARDEFEKLEQILMPLIAPLLRREKTSVASDIARHIELIRIFSANFCWRHRHLGASHGVVGQRPGSDEGGSL